MTFGMTDEQIKTQTETAAVAGPATGSAPASGSRMGRRGNERRPRRNDRRDRRGEPDDFEQKIVDLARVTRVMAGGKRMRFRACVVIGDKKGKVGLGLAKSNDVSTAIAKATERRRKRSSPSKSLTVPSRTKSDTNSARPEYSSNRPERARALLPAARCASCWSWPVSPTWSAKFWEPTTR